LWWLAPGAGDEGEEDIDNGVIKVGKRRTKNPPFILEADEDGRPLLPDVADLSLDKKKAVIREFISKHYSQCCR
jgi:hypothetical protein